MQVEFQGRIESHEGVVLFESVSGYFALCKPGSSIPWDGAFQINSGEKESMFEGKLITSTGRESTLSAHRYLPGSRQIHFRGNGPAPEEVPAPSAASQRVEEFKES